MNAISPTIRTSRIDRIAQDVVDIAINHCDALDVTRDSDAGEKTAEAMDAAAEWYEVEYECPGYITHDIYMAAYFHVRDTIKAEIDRLEYSYETAYMRENFGMVRS